MSEDRPMTPEYAKLSYRAALLASTADRHLGGNAFATINRFQSWNFTRQMIVELQSAALSLGVPENQIRYADVLALAILADDATMQAFLRAQAAHDRRE